MKISLERLDARGLQVDLPGTGGERIAIAAATGLRGTLEQEGERLALSGIAAETIALQALRIVLGELTLSSAAGATFEGLALSLVQSRGHLALQLASTSVVALDLTVAVADVLVTGRVELGGARLVIDGDDGSLEAERMALSAFTLRIGEVEVVAEAFLGTGVAIRWGKAGFSLAAATIDAPALTLATGDLRCAAKGVAVAAFALDERHIEVASIALAGGHVAVAFAPKVAPAARASSAPGAPSSPPGSASAKPAAEPLVDWHVLDFLSGAVDVDVDLDLTVPIIGSRQATHRLRVPIDGGSIDYRALENNLSALENAVLDFSVRDGALVLERVNPLFPARGHGKPVVVWDLDATDLAVAETNRVRLAVLPQARVVGSDDEAPKSQTEPSRSSIALRQVGLHRIDVRLALAPIEGPLAGTLRPRTVGSFVLQGSVFHHPGAPAREGRLLGEVSGAVLGVAHFRSGTTVVDIASATFTSISPIEVAFLDVHPTKVELDLSGVALEGVVVTLR